MRPSTVTRLPFLVSSSLLISLGTANLNGKNPSLESHALSYCIAADDVSSASGTAFFTSPLNDLIQIKRDLYFGLGSEAGAIENGSFRACSIFYHGASEPLSSDAISDGRRTQELSDDCVRDLTALVNRTAQGELMPQNDHDLSNVCKKLVEATAGDRPTACQNYNLGELHFQAFTNQNISSASGNGDCPTSDGDYRLTLVDSNGFVNANGSSNLKNMVLGATPIVTVFYPESNLAQPDIQYVAVKPEDTSGLLGQVSGSLASGFTAPPVFALGTLVITSAFLSGII